MRPRLSMLIVVGLVTYASAAAAGTTAPADASAPSEAAAGTSEVLQEVTVTAAHLSAP
jgi:hypothetical protein